MTSVLSPSPSVSSGSGSSHSAVAAVPAVACNENVAVRVPADAGAIAGVRDVPPPAAPRLRLVRGLIGSLPAVYLMWSSPSLAMGIAVVDMPPLMMAAIRFVLAGGLL